MTNPSFPEVPNPVDVPTRAETPPVTHLPTPKSPNKSLPSGKQGPEQHKAPDPLSAAGPSMSKRSGVIQLRPLQPKPSNPAGKVQPLPQEQAPKAQRTEKPGLDEPTVKLATSQSPLDSASVVEREATGPLLITLPRPSALVPTSEKIELQTHQTPVSTSDAAPVPSRESSERKQPLVPKSLAHPRGTDSQVSYGYSKTPEGNTVPTLGPVNSESSTPVPGPFTPSPPKVSLSY